MKAWRFAHMYYDSFRTCSGTETSWHCFPHNKCSTAEEAERAQSLRSHSSFFFSREKTPGHQFSRTLYARMVVTTTNWMLRSKDTELEIKNKSPVFKLPLFSLQLCLSLFGADGSNCIIIRKEGTLLPNIQCCSCHMVVMSCPRKIRRFHKRFCNIRWCSSRYVTALGYSEPLSRSSQHGDPPPPPHPSAPSQVRITNLLQNESGHSHCISRAVAESGWAIVSIRIWFGFSCSTASLIKFMTRSSKAVAWAFSSRSGIEPKLETGFAYEI